MPPCLWGNQEDRPLGSDIQGLSAFLLEAARRRNLSTNSLAAYKRTWTRFLAWAAAANFDPAKSSFPYFFGGVNPTVVSPAAI